MPVSEEMGSFLGMESYSFIIINIVKIKVKLLMYVSYSYSYAIFAIKYIAGVKINYFKLYEEFNEEGI